MVCQMKRLPFTDLRNGLLLIFLLAVVPSVSLVLYMNAQQERLLTQTAQDNALLLARFFAANQDRLVEDAHRTLAALGEIPAVRERTADCGPVLAAMLPRYSQFTNLSVSGSQCKRTGNLL